MDPAHISWFPAASIFRRKDRQIPSVITFAIIILLFWVYAAHLSFALFFGLGHMAFVLSLRVIVSCDF